VDGLLAYTLKSSAQGKGTLRLAGVAQAELPIAVATRTNDVRRVPASGKLEITYKGEGQAFLMGAVRYLRTAVARNEGCEVTRVYGKTETEENETTGVSKTRFVPMTEAVVTPGTPVDVQITLSCPKNLRYLFVEEPRPAGFEIDESVAEGGHLEVRDDRVALFVGGLDAKGTATVRYRMRPELTGEFHHSPTSVRGMYKPAVRGNTGAGKLTVRR
jgi:uncharacterized protein YfaS (alpha-2-macroglobulin family)